MRSELVVDVPLSRIPLPSQLTPFLGSIAVGIAQGALDDVLGLAAGKVPLFAPGALATSPLFQHTLATADARLRAARAVLYEDAAALYATAEAREPVTDDLRARVRASSIFATGAAADVVDVAYHCGGGTSLYATSPLQRRLRDIHALTQHFLVRPDAMVTCGAVMAGQEADTSLL
jgi:alkylation response protein AidB-like acyl-CoA dehydrogenase